MTHGLKVAGGDRLGKTIIFAKNHNHAQFIVERFDANYPHLKGSFARVIDNQIVQAQSLIDDFGQAEKAPHIAVSVDMLDTGIDVPEVVNLVFFKIVAPRPSSGSGAEKDVLVTLFAVAPVLVSATCGKPPTIGQRGRRHCRCGRIVPRNPHSTRGTGLPYDSRVPSLEAFGRPPRGPWPSSRWAGIRNPSHYYFFLEANRRHIVV
jgi:hypothetical protein